MKITCLAALCILVLAAPAHAQADVSGTWDLSFSTPNGPMNASLVVRKDGDRLAGTMSGPRGDVPVEGTQKDKAVALNLSVQTQNGPMAIALTGVQNGDAIAGTMEIPGVGPNEWSGKRRAGAAAAATATAATPAAQGDKPADVAGTWVIALDLGQGTVGTPSVTFKQDGEKLTGTYSSQVLGEHPVTGTIKGSEIAFGFTATFEGNSVAVSYTGTVDKDSMKGKVKLGDFGEGTFTAKKK